MSASASSSILSGLQNKAALSATTTSHVSRLSRLSRLTPTCGLVTDCHSKPSTPYSNTHTHTHTHTAFLGLVRSLPLPCRRPFLKPSGHPTYHLFSLPPHRDTRSFSSLSYSTLLYCACGACICKALDRQTDREDIGRISSWLGSNCLLH